MKDPAILLLDIYPKKSKALNQNEICIYVFIAALFTIVKIWKQPKCRSIDEWMKNKWCIYTIQYDSSTKIK